jgi:hypothetical protein
MLVSSYKGSILGAINRAPTALLIIFSGINPNFIREGLGLIGRAKRKRVASSYPSV